MWPYPLLTTEELRVLCLEALNCVPRFKVREMKRDSYWLAAQLSETREPARVRHLLALTLEAFNARERFSNRRLGIDTYEVAGRLDRYFYEPAG